MHTAIIPASLLIGLTLMFTSSSSEARAYRCTDADGNVSYSQSPCSANQTGARMHGVGSTTSVDSGACSHIRTFATASHDKLRRGTGPSRQIEQFGGPSYINKITLNVINFVGGFRLNKYVHAMQVGGMAYSKCLNGGFGRLQSSDLPAEILPLDLPDTSFHTAVPGLPEPALANGKRPQNDIADNQRQRLCRNYELQLEALNRAMRKGYDARSGQSMRQQRQQIETLLQSYCHS